MYSSGEIRRKDSWTLSPTTLRSNATSRRPVRSSSLDGLPRSASDGFVGRMSETDSKSMPESDSCSLRSLRLGFGGVSVLV